MIALALIAVLGAAPAPAAPVAPVATQAAKPKPDPVTEPEWLAVPNPAMMENCTTGYLTDPNFTGETIVMGCVVQQDGTLGQCQVKETRKAQAAGVQDVAVCSAAGFRIGPLDKFKKPTVGRPVIIPMAIATVVPNAPAAPAQPAPPAPAQPK